MKTKYFNRSRKDGHYTRDKAVRLIIRRKYKDICQICRRKYNKQLAALLPDTYFDIIHIDHIIPFSRQGSNHIANYSLLCRDCNLKKGAYIENEY